MMRNLILLLAIASFGCASVSQIAVKDGKPLYESTCRRTAGDCHALAAQQCNGSYDVIQSTATWFNEIGVIFTCKEAAHP